MKAIKIYDNFIAYRNKYGAIIGWCITALKSLFVYTFLSRIMIFAPTVPNFFCRFRKRVFIIRQFHEHLSMTKISTRIRPDCAFQLAYDKINNFSLFPIHPYLWKISLENQWIMWSFWYWLVDLIRCEGNWYPKRPPIFTCWLLSSIRDFNSLNEWMAADKTAAWHFLTTMATVLRFNHWNQ